MNRDDTRGPYKGLPPFARNPEKYDKDPKRCPWINLWCDGSGSFDQCSYEPNHRWSKTLKMSHSFHHTPAWGEW